ncbi:GntR family transcriptional regulator [Desulfospira joergensenii]|uniref:GntR family transcriptional regulator n=1 Tax=Desulfospira joergensenii TaxID=53329 RepID=UPI0003B302EA|nr:GntR family transcriptional regulator [Desulfospira joergensenii]
MNNEIEQMGKLIGSSIPFRHSEDMGSPLYFQLAKSIQMQIEKGTLTPETRLPSERRVSALNNLSLATVRKAFEELVRKGFIHRVQGKGTFVTSASERLKKIRFYQFVDNFESEHFNTSFIFLGLKIVKGNQKIWDYLNLSKGQELFELKRLVLPQNKPLVYCTSYFPRKLFKGLENYSQSELEKNPLYIFLENEFNIPMISHIELFGVSLAEKEVADHLNINLGHPLLEIEKLIFTHQKKPFEYRKSLCLTDDFKLKKTFSADRPF